MDNRLSAIDASIQEAATELVAAVDAREKKTKNPDRYDYDWSDRVYSTLDWQLDVIEKRSTAILRVAPNSGPDYILIEKQLFEREIRAAKEKMEKTLFVNKKLIDGLVQDIRGDFGYEGNEDIEWLAFKSMIDQPPREGKKAEEKDYDPLLKNPYEIIYNPYSFGLDRRPYGTRVLSYAFGKAVDNGHYSFVLDPLFKREIIPNYDEIAARCFEKAFAEPDPSTAIRFFTRFQGIYREQRKFSEPLVEGALPVLGNGYTVSDEPGVRAPFENVPESKFDELFARAAIKDPDEFLSSIDHAHFEWVPNLERHVINAFNSNELTVRYVHLGQIEIILGRAMAGIEAEKWAIEILKTQPTMFFVASDVLKNYIPQEYLGRHLMDAFNSVALADRCDYFIYIENILGKERASVEAEKWMIEVLKSKPSRIFSEYITLRWYVPPEHLEPCLLRAAENDPQAALPDYDRYKMAGNAAEVFRLAADLLLKRDYPLVLSNYGNLAFTNNFGLLSAGYEDRLIQIGIERYPDLLLQLQGSVGRIQGRTDWPQIVSQCEARAAMFKTKKEEAVRILLHSIPANRKVESNELARRSEELLADPAIALYPTIQLEWIPIQDKSLAVQTAIILLRNLIVQNLEPTRENIETAYSQFLAVREENKNIRIFEGRNVLMVSHSETYSDRDRFGRASLDSAMRRKQKPGVQFEHVEPKKKSLQSVRECKERALNLIETLPSPMTFLFDGHAWRGGLYMSDGNISGTALSGNAPTPFETQNTIKITPSELAQAFLKRQNSGKDPSLDILILNGCDTFLFAKNLYEELDRLNVKKPIIISPSEYGQYGFSRYESAYGDDFWDTLMRSQNPSLGDLWPMREMPLLNPSVFIPINGVPMQFAENETRPTTHVG